MASIENTDITKRMRITEFLWVIFIIHKETWVIKKNNFHESKSRNGLKLCAPEH